MMPKVLGCLTTVLLLCACERSSIQEDVAPEAKTITTPVALQSKAILLPHDEPEFPPGPGREIFVSRCIVCHSLRYISMQPDFSEETWAKEVDKMKNTWGAHITDDEAKQIVAYLLLVKGKKP